MAASMRIGEIARLTGLDVQAVRHYEKEGLLEPPARAANGYRAYGQAHLERLAFIRHCRALDMGLADIRALLRGLDGPGADCSDVDRVVDRQLERVRARLASLRGLERQLGKLRESCRVSGDAKGCGILQELVHAAQGEACACHETEPC